MENNQKIIESIFETNAFQHLDKPVILTSGELGIYYCNTEKLCQDNGEFEMYGNHAVTEEVNNKIEKGMREHALMLYEKNRIFRQVIDILASMVDSRFNIMQPLIENEDMDMAVSGGQRRDWLFSFPVAHVLGVNHIAIYKNGRMQVTFPGTVSQKPVYDGMPDDVPLGDQYAIHVADLLTEGSSARNIWVPSLRKAGATIDYMFNVVSRKQGGEEALAALNPKVNAESLVTISPEFIMMGKGTPEQKQQAIDYMKNPRAWSEKYITEQGIDAFVKSFDPEGKKLDRARKFIEKYKDVLEHTESLADLSEKVHQAYGISIMDNKWEAK